MSKEVIVERFDDVMVDHRKVNEAGNIINTKRKLTNLYKVTNRNGDSIVIDEKELIRLGFELPKDTTKHKQVEQKIENIN